MTKLLKLYTFLIVFLFSLNIIAQSSSYKMLSISINNGFTFYEYKDNHTKTEVSNDSNYSENYYELLFGKEDSAEFSIYYKKLSFDNISISNGIWNVSKTLIGVNFGKIVTFNLKIPKNQFRFPLEFSGGFFAQYASKKEYEHISGKENEDVESGSGASINYGVYTSIRLRVAYLRDKYKIPSIVIGFKYLYPLNEFEYNSQNDIISYRLFRKFIFIGIYF